MMLGWVSIMFDYWGGGLTVLIAGFWLLHVCDLKMAPLVPIPWRQRIFILMIVIDD